MMQSTPAVATILLIQIPICRLEYLPVLLVIIHILLSQASILEYQIQLLLASPRSMILQPLLESVAFILLILPGDLCLLCHPVTITIILLFPILPLTILPGPDS